MKKYRKKKKEEKSAVVSSSLKKEDKMKIQLKSKVKRIGVKSIFCG
jgi:hypothetical protein